MAQANLARANAGRPVTAVIVTYQSAATIGPALASMRRGFDAGLLECVVVDNGSVDATLDIVGREAGWARIVATGKNNGFGLGCNIGFEKATTPYVVFVNPDAVIEPDALRTMLSFMDGHPAAGIAGPAIIEGDAADSAEYQMTGKRPTPASVLRAAIPMIGRPVPSYPILPGAAPSRTEWVCGAVLMARSELMRRLNGFDPRFFLYWEETDLCLRAEQTGFEVWALGAAVATHVGGASTQSDDTKISGCIAKHYFQSRHYYLAKHHGRLAAAAAELGEFVLVALGALLDVLRGRGMRRLRPRLQARLFSQPARR